MRSLFGRTIYQASPFEPLAHLIFSLPRRSSPNRSHELVCRAPLDRHDGLPRPVGGRCLWTTFPNEVRSAKRHLDRSGTAPLLLMENRALPMHLQSNHKRWFPDADGSNPERPRRLTASNRYAALTGRCRRFRASIRHLSAI